MSISSEITRISGNVSDALTAIANKGVTVPSGSNSDDLADLIGQISTGSTEVITIEDTTDTAGGTIRTITAVDISDTTATASDVASGKYFYTANGTKTAGTASGGSGGLVYETGTYTPASDVLQPTISFANAHSTRPMFVMIADQSSTSISENSEGSFIMTSWYDAFGNTIDTESNVYYGRRQGNYRATNNTLGSSGGNETTLSSSYFDSTQFKPTNGSSYYWRSGRTYKWIAVWAPTT